MKKIPIFVYLSALVFSTFCISAEPEEPPQEDNEQSESVERAPTDAEIKQILIQRSINSYTGSCPCPYNRASNGSRCGGRSAYSRPGGASPLCYEADVTDEMVAQYKRRNDR